MASPSSDVIAKRRYHKHRQQSKRKDRGKHNYGREANTYKMSSNKPNVPAARITHRRLTNKSGFCLKGAVVTSPHSRGSRGHNARKATKRSSDFDLQCLLRAAKSRDMSSECYSSTGSIYSGGSNNSPDLTKPPVEKDRKRKKYVGGVTQFPPKTVHSQSSSENNITTCDGLNQDFDGVLPTRKSSYNNPIEIYQRGHYDDTTALRHHSADLNTSNENNASHQTKIRPCSLSAYQKFAVGIVEALHAEKKKQFPSEYWLEVTQDLNNIYNKTHGKEPLEDQFSSDMEAANITHYVSTELTGAGELDIKGEQMKMERQIVSKVNIQPAPEGSGHLQGQEEMNFKEKRVKAWINSIPARVSNEDKKTHKRNNNPPMKQITHLETEREFLRNIKNKSTCITKALNPFENVDNSFTWAVQDSNVFGNSPNMPPHAPKQMNKINCAKGAKGHKSEQSNFPSLLFGSDMKREDEKCGALWISNSPNSPLAKQATRPQKLPRSWTSWFKDSKENPITKEKSQRLVPLQLSPFDPPTPKLKRLIKEDYGDKENANTKRHTSAHKPSMWSQFPKLFKTDKNESAEITNCYNIKKRNYKEYKPSPANTDFIKFSPRKMF